jgi:hypothetical protein
MMVSATIRGTLPAAAKLLDGALHACLSHADCPGPTGTIALEPAPASLLTVAAECLTKDLCLGAAFLLGQALHLSDQVRGKRERADTSRHRSGGQLI